MRPLAGRSPRRAGRCPVLGLVAVAMLAAACGKAVIQDSGPGPGQVDVSRVLDAVPRVEPKSKYGNPESYVVFGKTYHVRDSSEGFVERGIASWYGEKFHGRRTSNGETYDMYAMTAAHKHLPLPTYVRVTSLENGKSIIVRVNDRGPFHENRIIDLSYTAAAKLDIVRAGTGLVEVRAIGASSYEKSSAPVVASANSGARQFFIQVGAFSSRNNADNLRRRLSVLGQNLVLVKEAVVNGARLYRVQLGPLSSIAQSDSLVGRLGGLGIGEHHIVLD